MVAYTQIEVVLKKLFFARKDLNAFSKEAPIMTIHL